MANKKKGRSKITVYPDWCKGCGICVEFCPGRVLELSGQGKATVVREQDCIRCGFCELHCPDFAIVVQDKDFVEADKLPRRRSAKTTDKGA